MPSLRHFAQCIGLQADFSVVHDFFGLRSIPLGREVSLQAQMNRLQHSHFHFNVILVGNFSSTELDKVNLAVFDTRRIYSKAAVGVGRVRWFAVPVSMADGHEDIASDDEAEELTNSWTVHNNGLDVFVVRSGWVEDGEDRNGLSDQRASCDKDAGKSMSGSVVSLSAGMPGNTMAHEIGHDLGLVHIVELEKDEIDEATDAQFKNLMFPFSADFASEQLQPTQVFVILTHCLMRPGC